MPFVIPGARRGGRIIAAALTMAGLMTASAQAATISNPYDCTPSATLSQTFSQFNDFGQYTPVPNAGLENGTTGWMVGGAASVVTGNEPWKVGGATHAKSLRLGPESAAVTPPICIDQTYPYFRFFARNVGASTGKLKIDTLFYDAKGNVQSTKSVTYGSSYSGWLPTFTVNIPVWSTNTTVAAAPVAFRFSTDKGSSYQIDDVYVDPWARR